MSDTLHPPRLAGTGFVDSSRGFQPVAPKRKDLPKQPETATGQPETVSQKPLIDRAKAALAKAIEKGEQLDPDAGEEEVRKYLSKTAVKGDKESDEQFEARMKTLVGEEMQRRQKLAETLKKDSPDIKDIAEFLPHLPDKALAQEYYEGLRFKGMSLEDYAESEVKIIREAMAAKGDRLGEDKANQIRADAKRDFIKNAKYEEPAEKPAETAQEQKVKQEAKLPPEQQEQQEILELVNGLMDLTDRDEYLLKGNSERAIATQRLHTQLILVRQLYGYRELDIPESVRKLMAYDALSEAKTYLETFTDEQTGKKLKDIWGIGAGTIVDQDGNKKPQDMFITLEQRLNKGPVEGMGDVHNYVKEVLDAEGKPVMVNGKPQTKIEVVWDNGIRHDTYLWLKSKLATSGVSFWDEQVEKLVTSGKFADAVSTMYMADFNNHNDKKTADRTRRILDSCQALKDSGLGSLFGRNENQGLIGQFMEKFYGAKSSEKRQLLDRYMTEMAQTLYKNNRTFGEKYGDKAKNWSMMILMLGMMKFNVLNEGVFFAQGQDEGH